MNTKERIIKNALTLFSSNGFEAVSLRDIAKLTNIKASSIYNHFKNKQDIFNAIIDKYYNLYLKDLNYLHDFSKTEAFIKNNFSSITTDDFADIALNIFSYYFKNENMIKFRRILIIEKFHNNEIFQLYRKIFIDDIIKCNSTFFKLLIKYKFIDNIDSDVLGLQFYSPVFVLFSRSTNPTNEDLSILRTHIIYFLNYYTIKG